MSDADLKKYALKKKFKIKSAKDNAKNIILHCNIYIALSVSYIEKYR